MHQIERQGNQYRTDSGMVRGFSSRQYMLRHSQNISLVHIQIHESKATKQDAAHHTYQQRIIQTSYRLRDQEEMFSVSSKPWHCVPGCII